MCVSLLLCSWLHEKWIKTVPGKWHDFIKWLQFTKYILEVNLRLQISMQILEFHCWLPVFQLSKSSQAMVKETLQPLIIPYTHKHIIQHLIYNVNRYFANVGSTDELLPLPLRFLCITFNVITKNMQLIWKVNTKLYMN